MKTNPLTRVSLLSVFAALLLPFRTDAAPFTPGNLAVVRVGTGGAALNSSAAATFIEEYTPAGVLVQIIPLPSSVAPMLTMNGSATAEGALMRSPDGGALCFGGYSAPAGTATVTTTSGTTAPREVATVDGNGNFAVAASSTTQFSGQAVRNGVTDGLNNYWGSGSATPGGTYYYGFTAAAVTVQGAITSTRVQNIQNSTLYMSTATGTGSGPGVYGFPGTPTGPAPATIFISTGAGTSPYGFAINPAGTIAYIADDRTILSGGGIQRWNNSLGTWSLAYTFNTGTGTRGLVVDWSGPNPIVYATTAETSNNRLVAVTDTGAGSPSVTLAAVGANKAFRGVAFAPLARVPQPHFFNSTVLPPSNGVYVHLPGTESSFSNGIKIRNVSHKKFLGGQPPPPPGGSQNHSFGSTVEMDVSSDGGVSYQHVAAPANVTVHVTHTSDDPGTNTSSYDTEMLQLDISGGTLPAGVMVRESPTLASTGKTTIQAIDGGFMIDSFFDVFTELSLDGGANWTPSSAAAHVDLKVDPTLIPPIKAPTTLLPPPNDLYISPALYHVLFAQGIIIRDIKHRFFTQSLPAPALGQSNVHTFDSQVDMQVSTDGGATFNPLRSPAAVTVRVTHTRDEGTTQIFETEMQQLDLQGGDLPPGIMLRESPTRRSEGGTAIAQPATGDPDFDLLRIGSFFDVFVDLTVDGGNNWSPAQSGPAHVELDCKAPEVTESSPNLPPLPDQYVSPADYHAAFAAGIIIKDISHDRFTQSQPPPPPGGTQFHSFDSRVRFMVSTDGGATFNPASAPAHVVVQVSSSIDQGATRFFDTEMLALDIAGGTLPPGVMVRESPSKASLGRTSIRTTASGYETASLFDVFTELSFDGGASWQPSTTGPTEVVLEKAPKPHFFTTSNLPPPNGMYVSPADFHAAYANGIIIRNPSHRKFTQSQPPPPPGGTQIDSFGSEVSLDVSTDGGATFSRVSAPATVEVRVTHSGSDGTTSSYDTEMLSLLMAGGNLPPGVMIRESPTRASIGRTNIRTVDGGFEIDSFFDVFTDLSVDGGQIWFPASEAGHVELAIDPLTIPPITAPSQLLPPPNDLYISPALYHALFAQGIIIRDVKHHFFTQSLPPPPLGATEIHSFDSQVDMQVSIDGGATFQPVRAPAAVTVSLTHTHDEDTTQFFETEMLALNVAGGDLPPGIMLRESPTRRSEGGTAIALNSDGTNRIGSFFDVFPELSVDGGQNWSPSTNAPAHVELICNAPEAPEETPLLPPPLDEYVSPADYHAAYANGIIIKDVKHDRFTQSTPPPPPGGSQFHTFDSTVTFRVSNNGGASFTRVSAPAHVAVRVTSSAESGPTRFYDTEMLSLDIAGGGLPAGVMVRESPSKASLGRTSIRSTPTNFDISSFFDVFTELSTDGGQTWQPSLSPPVEMVLHTSDDRDHDGMQDAWEIAFFGDTSHGPNEDYDGDGESNLEEYLAGTDPTDPTSVLRAVATIVNSEIRVSFRSILGHVYRVECKTDLEIAAQPWLPVLSGIQGDGSVITVVVGPVGGVPKRFYRVVVELP